MDASRTRTVTTLVTASMALSVIVLSVIGAGLVSAAPSTGSTAPSTGPGTTGDPATASPFQGVPSWLLIVVGIVVIAFAIRVVARRDEGNRGLGGGRAGTDRPRRPFRPD